MSTSTPHLSPSSCTSIPCSLSPTTVTACVRSLDQSDHTLIHSCSLTAVGRSRLGHVGHVKFILKWSQALSLGYVSLSFPFTSSKVQSYALSWETHLRYVRYSVEHCCRVLTWWCTHRNMPSAFLGCSDGYFAKMKLDTVCEM